MEPIIIKMLEYAPAVAILLYLNWRTSRMLNKVLELCLKELFNDESSNSE